MFYFILFCLMVAIFIFGITILRAGLFNLASNSLKHWLEKLTDTPIKGLLVGMIITAALHSSSAVMVITISLISAGIITFRQSIGIILGTNIGTTFTAEMITLDIDVLIAPMALIGSILYLFKKKWSTSLGSIFLGMAAIFGAMKGLELISSPLTLIPAIQEFIVNLGNSSLLSIITGATLTAIIQSSTATTGLIMGLLPSGTIEMNTAIALLLGSNIGTCITGYIASIGAGKESRLCAYSHIWLNVLGVLLFFPFISYFSQLLSMTEYSPDVQLAHFSVLFNILSSILVLPFSNRFAQMVLFLHGKR